MTQQAILSIDAMGGDAAPGPIIAGAARFCETDRTTKLLFHGIAAEIAPLIDKYRSLAGRYEVVDVVEVVAMDAKPSQAMRKKGTSMWSAIEAVKTGRANAIVSAGNTGALMAVAHLQLRTLEHVHRPAIAAQWPTMKGGRTIVLDVGANVECDPDMLVDFAIMGEAYARALSGKSHPTIGLLNVGSEEMKGHEEIREALKLLRAHGDSLGLKVHGFVEGNDISYGSVDVVVTDGFTGNVALKTGEGAAKMVAHYLRAALTDSLLSKLGALFAYGGLKKLRATMDPRKSNGGVFLGLGGLVIKAHGGSDAIAFESALNIASAMAGSDFLDSVQANLERLAIARKSALEIGQSSTNSPPANAEAELVAGGN